MDNNYDGFDQYLKDIDKIKILTDYEQKNLLIKAKNGDIFARNTLIESNLRLVVSIAKSYARVGIQIDDLVQEGSKGVMDAINHFDIDRETPFSIYATYWIREYIGHFIHKSEKSVFIPYDKHELIRKLKKMQSILLKRLDHEPTNDEIASKLGISVSKLEEVQIYGQEEVSLNEIYEKCLMEEVCFNEIFTDMDVEKRELIPVSDESVEKNFEVKELREKILKLIDKCSISPRDKKILFLVFGINTSLQLTQEQIGKKFNMTRQGVNYIVKSSLKKLRLLDEVYELAPYLDKPDMAITGIMVLLNNNRINSLVRADIISFIYELQNKNIDLELCTDELFQMSTLFPNVNLNVLKIFLDCGFDLITSKIIILKYGLGCEPLNIQVISNSLKITTELILKLETISLIKIRNSVYYNDYAKSKNIKKI